MRTVLTPVLAITFAVLAGCGTEAGPTPKGQARDPGPAAFGVKLNALTVDQCYRAPEQQDPPGCAKYVTQLGSVPGSARKYAGTAHPELVRHSAELDKGIKAYRAGSCHTANAGEGCSQALADIATALGAVRSSLTEVIDAATTTG